MDRHIALVRRLPSEHKDIPFILDKIRIKEAGSRGEDRLSLKLRELRVPWPFHIFSDIYLQVDDWTVQLDCLIVTDRCCIVLESKNISGELHFDANTEEFYRLEASNVEIPFRNPYYQLLKQIRFMKTFFHESFPHLAVTGAVVMTSKSCRIRNKPSHYPIFKLESIIEKINHLYNHSDCRTLLSATEITTITQILHQNKSSLNLLPLCQQYRISPQEIQTGVECPHCKKLGMIRQTTTWTCKNCKKNDRHAHIAAVNDYFWLIKKEITNKEFRRFCQLHSKYAASRMLNSMNLQAHGAGPARYFTSKEEE